MKVGSGGKGKDTSNGVAADVRDLRSLLSEINEMRREHTLLTARLQHKETEYNLKMAQACMSRRALQGWGLDLSDGHLKPVNEIQPYKG